MTHRSPNRIRRLLVPVLAGLVAVEVAEAETNSPEVVEISLRGDRFDMFPGMGWLNPQMTGIRAVGVNASVDGRPSTLFYSPDEQPNEIFSIAGNLAGITNRVGRLDQWEGMSMWIRGCGTPGDAVFRWQGRRYAHEARIPIDTKTWRKVHVPWNRFVPRVNPRSPPQGPMSVLLERTGALPDYTVICVDPVVSNTPPRHWSEAQPREATAVAEWQGKLLRRDEHRWPESRGIHFWAKNIQRDVYGRIGWVGALDQGISFLVESNFWQAFQVDWADLPPPEDREPVLRLFLEPYPYAGLWMMVDRLHLYRGITDEPVRPWQREEAALNLPALSYTRNSDHLEVWRRELFKGLRSPRLVWVCDNPLSGTGLAYLGKQGEQLLEHAAPRRFGRDLQRAFRIVRLSVSQMAFSESSNQFLPLGESLDPFDFGLRVLALHVPGIRTFRRSDGVQRVERHDPDWVLVHLGQIDMELMDPPAFAEELGGLLDDLLARGLRPVVVSPVPVLDTRPPPNRPGASRLRESLAFRDVCDQAAAARNLPFIDLTLALLARGTGAPGGYYADPVRLNREGHRFVARLLSAFFRGRDLPLWHDAPEVQHFMIPGFDTRNYLARNKQIDISRPYRHQMLEFRNREVSDQTQLLLDEINTYIGDLHLRRLEENRPFIPINPYQD